jgi:cytochrome c biogenesis protein CcmG/thiol:disulfide interchange protein DsbE|tara:strand:- start:301 stop:822 length:522 start_codon:yes stop_codon:yes gene_type:complete
MKNKFLFLIIILFLVFCFIVLYKGLNYSNIYVPQKNFEKKIPTFIAKDFYLENEINSEKIFLDDKIYILNIWASWCLPCKKEHPILMELSKNKAIKLIGLNYRDNINNAKKFIEDLGNPYSQILIDKDGTLAVEWGAYGVPETFIINKKKRIIKKIIGPLNKELLEEIKPYLK